MDFQKKSMDLLLSVLIAYAVLVGSHNGEFWPFSIFPMFSQAGIPWTKTLVRDVTNIQDTTWDEVNQLSHMSGEPVALQNIGVNQNDLSSLITKTEKWDTERISALRSFFSQKLMTRKLLI